MDDFLLYRPPAGSHGPDTQETALDPKLLFWTFALANMAVVVGATVRGVRAIRAGDTVRHRRSMLTAGALVLLFLGSYVVKRIVLGGEDLAVWSPLARTNLYVHETFVTTMLLTGAIAWTRGRKLARTRRVTGDAADPAPDASTLRWHRRAGWTAVVCGGLGFVTACGILAGMFSR